MNKFRKLKYSVVLQQPRPATTPRATPRPATPRPTAAAEVGVIWKKMGANAPGLAETCNEQPRSCVSMRQRRAQQPRPPRAGVQAGEGVLASLASLARFDAAVPHAAASAQQPQPWPPRAGGRAGEGVRAAGPRALARGPGGGGWRAWAGGRRRARGLGGGAARSSPCLHGRACGPGKAGGPLGPAHSRAGAGAGGRRRAQ